jgi:hypothetical protein
LVDIKPPAAPGAAKAAAVKAPVEKKAGKKK